jgi:hypothetical protein
LEEGKWVFKFTHMHLRVSAKILTSANRKQLCTAINSKVFSENGSEGEMIFNQA